MIALGILASFFSLPFVFQLLGDVLEEARQEMGISENLFNALLVFQLIVISSVSAIIGGVFYKKAGFSLTLLEKMWGGQRRESRFKILGQVVFGSRSYSCCFAYCG